MQKQSLGLAVWVLTYMMALSVVAIELYQGEQTTIGAIAGLWLFSQALGLAAHLMGIGIRETKFWSLFADASDGGIDSPSRRAFGWVLHGLLDHFSLIQYPKGIYVLAAITAQKKN